MDLFGPSLHFLTPVTACFSIVPVVYRHTLRDRLPFMKRADRKRFPVLVSNIFN